MSPPTATVLLMPRGLSLSAGSPSNASWDLLLSPGTGRAPPTQSLVLVLTKSQAGCRHSLGHPEGFSRCLPPPGTRW